MFGFNVFGGSSGSAVDGGFRYLVAQCLIGSFGGSKQAK